jgi:hypothetical protein
MRWDEIDDSLCGLARTLGVIGDRWTMLVLRECFLGTRRYDEFQQNLDAAPHIVAGAPQETGREQRAGEAALPGPPAALRSTG